MAYSTDDLYQKITLADLSDGEVGAPSGASQRAFRGAAEALAKLFPQLLTACSTPRDLVGVLTAQSERMKAYLASRCP